MESSSQAKGNSLEDAVELIEQSIFHVNPAFKECTLTINKKKTLMADGVRHEIDLYVEIDLGNGYTSTFIFECKNWEESVGKNEILEFSEKIKVAKAQKGFFIAKSFGVYAKAQARKDNRIELLEVDDNFSLDVFPDFHAYSTQGVNTEIEMHQRDEAGAGKIKMEPIDVDSAKMELRGKVISRNQLLEWIQDVAIQDRLKN